MHRVNLDIDDLIDRYRSGQSENRLAHHFGVGRPTIRRRLLEAGVTPRGQSEAEALKWSTMTAEQRARQTAAAHAAVRGSTKSFESKCRTALGKQARWQPHASPAELTLRRMLAARGIRSVPQQAIGPYNCDLACDPVAVEIFGGNWHWSGHHAACTPDRLRYLIDAGWHVLMVRIEHGAVPSAVGQYVASYVELARGRPSARREYRVVRGAGDLLAAGGRDDCDRALVWPRRSVRDPVSGRYEGVAK